MRVFYMADELDTPQLALNIHPVYHVRIVARWHLRKLWNGKFPNRTPIDGMQICHRSKYYTLKPLMN